MLDYKSSGVDAQKKEGSLNRLLEYVNKTFTFNRCPPMLPIGFYANVIDLRPIGVPIGIAFSTDGVGTKLLVAEMMNKYDSVGIDCVAMNVNDILCVGATPVSMVDYIAVSEAKASLLDEIAAGLYKGCELAGISLSGGELAQVKELLANRPNAVSFDIVGTAIGTVDPDKLVTGNHIQPGDVLIGLESTGLHSNGYSLARKLCFEVEKLSVQQFMDDFGCTLGEELLRPTRIYVKEILQMMEQVHVKGLFHITGDGFLNLLRTSVPVAYHIETIPTPPPIFSYLQQAGQISNEEMFRVFNMGIGFVIVCEDNSDPVSRIREIARKAGYNAHRLGYVLNNEKRVVDIEPYRIRGEAGSFHAL